MAPRHLSEHLFFYFQDGQVVVNNYATNEEYFLEPAYFDALRAIAETGRSGADAICDELAAGGLLANEPPPPDEWGWDVIGKIFHFGTQYPYPRLGREEAKALWLNDRKVLHDRPVVPEFSEREGDLVALPDPTSAALEDMSVAAVMRARSTCRDFLGKSISLETLSNVLHGTFGLIHGTTVADYEAAHVHYNGVRRAYPSGGNVHAEDIYVVGYRVDDLQPGLYHYRPTEHALTLIESGDFEDTVIGLNGSQHFSAGLAFGCYVVLRFDRAWWKYPDLSREYRVLLMDVGHAAQTYQLVATAHGLQTWLTGAFEEASINAFLGIDARKESAIIFLGSGIGTGARYPADYLDAARALETGRDQG